MLNGKWRKGGCCFPESSGRCLTKRRYCQDSGSPLSKKSGSGRIRVCKVTGDRKICARMASMGLYPGVEAEVICPENGNRCILKVNGGTISLDAEISGNILVTNL
ncbi:MAG: FeoA family protein [Desulforhopalus sp.]|nr:FeoA family protein [Desulforhopalus sp.]